MTSAGARSCAVAAAGLLISSVVQPLRADTAVAALDFRATRSSDTPAESSQKIHPNFPITVGVATDANGNLALSGLAEPRTRVTVELGGAVIASAPVDLTGNWGVRIDGGLGAGDHDLTVRTDRGRDDVRVYVPALNADRGIEGRSMKIAASTADADLIRLLVLADATVPPVRRERPQDTGQRPTIQYSEPPAAFQGFWGRLREWLARANREYQETIVRQLSRPTPAEQAELDATARAVKALETRAVRAKRLEDARAKAAEARRAAATTLSPAAGPTFEQPADAAQSNERQRAEEAEKLGNAQLVAEQRRALEERRLLEEREKTAAKVADERRKLDEANASRHRRRTITLVPEPLSPDDRDAPPSAADTLPGRDAKQPDAAPLMPSPARPAAPPAVAAETGAEQPQTSPEVASRETSVEPETDARPVVFYPDVTVTRSSRRTAVRRWVRRDGGNCGVTTGRRVGMRYTVRRGDTLWGISKRFYGAGRLYGRIFRANRDIIRDADMIYPCQRFVIPRRGAR